MFTGIVTAIGKVARVARVGPEAIVEVACDYDALVLGESIAVDGVCLTVVTAPKGAFTANASVETLERSTLNDRSVGDRVNLERALRVEDRLGGHIVSGHVDGVGRIRSRTRVGEAERWSFYAPREVLRFVAEKGSIAIDGVSLTVNALDDEGFEVMLVPFTQKGTTLGEKSVGASVNLEVDVIARYVARMMQQGASGSTVSLSLLERAGFLGNKK